MTTDQLSGQLFASLAMFLIQVQQLKIPLFITFSDLHRQKKVFASKTFLSYFLQTWCSQGCSTITSVSNWLRGGGNRAVTKLCFGHITTKNWAYSGVFGFFRKSCCGKTVPPPTKSIYDNTMGNPFFYCFNYWPKPSIFLTVIS